MKCNSCPSCPPWMRAKRVDALPAPQRRRPSSNRLNNAQSDAKARMSSFKHQKLRVFDTGMCRLEGVMPQICSNLQESWSKGNHPARELTTVFL